MPTSLPVSRQPSIPTAHIKRPCKTSASKLSEDISLAREVEAVQIRPARAIADEMIDLKTDYEAAHGVITAESIDKARNC